MIEDKELFDSSNIASYLTINELNVDEELATCARFYYLYADLAADADVEYERHVLVLEQYEAGLSKQIKTILLNEGVRQDKITETEIKRKFREDSKWMELKHQELDLHTKLKKLEKITKAFEMKNQSCMSLNKRQLFKVSKGMLGLEDL